jgi:hypothetical protein
MLIELADRDSNLTSSLSTYPYPAASNPVPLAIPRVGRSDSEAIIEEVVVVVAANPAPSGDQ